MQFQFEFDAPRYFSFVNLTQKRISSDYTLHDSDETDFWFMHTHEKPPQSSSFQSFSNDKEVIPVVRTQIETQQQPLNKICENQAKVEEIQENIQKGNQQSSKLSINPIQRLVKNNFLKKNKITMRKTLIGNPKLNATVKHQSTEKSEKPANISKAELRAKSSLHRPNPRDIRPCPFPPRVQRQWELKYEKKWYSLSPSSKIQAQKMMKQIQEQKQNKDKGNVLKQDLSKRQRYRGKK